MQATKEYDKLNRLNSIKHVLANGRDVDFTYTYNDAHQRDIMTREDETYWDYGYDSLGQVSEAVSYWSDDTRVVGKQFEFDYDDIGNRTSSLKGGDSSGNNKRTTSYSDNSVNQITSLTLPGYSEVQGVAPEFASVTVNSQSAERKGEYYRKEIATDSSSGNLFTSVTVSATGLTSTSGGIFTPESPFTLSYDDYGNLTEDGRWKYEWSAENRLIKMYTRDAVVTDLSATSFQPQTIEFQYDELGRRISKDVYDGGVRLKKGGMKIFKGQRPDTYQPGLPSPGLVHLYFQGLKARHIKKLFEKGYYECVGPSALLIEENAVLGLAAQAGMCRAVGAGGLNRCLNKSC